MPQLDFSVAFTNFLFLAMFFIFFFIFFYYFIFNKLFKLLLVRKFLSENLNNKWFYSSTFKNNLLNSNFSEIKKILIFFKIIN